MDSPSRRAVVLVAGAGGERTRIDLPGPVADELAALAFALLERPGVDVEVTSPAGWRLVAHRT
jgi:hypothetical protein